MLRDSLKRYRCRLAPTESAWIALVPTPHPCVPLVDVGIANTALTLGA